MIKFIKKHADKFLYNSTGSGGQMLVFMPSTIATVSELSELNITAYPLYAGQDSR